MILDEKVSDKVKKQLQGLYDQAEALKLSKEQIINNLIMYAPVQDSAKTKEENKAVATEFYRIRDAINNVYHLDWLEKK
jgi:acetolactate synthase small subunit